MIFKRICLITISIFLGILYVLVYYHLFNNWHFKDYNKGQPVAFRGEVVQVYDQNAPSYFKIKLSEINKTKIAPLKKVNALLSWYKPLHQIKKGAIINGTAKFKPFRSYKNQKVKNNEIWAFKQNIKLTGYIDNKYTVTVINNQNSSYSDLFKQHIGHIFKDTNAEWLYLAILSGDKSAIPKEVNKQFQYTGLSHLMAISGLHIGMLFGIGFYFMKSMLFVLPFKQKQHFNTNFITISFGLVTAFIYAWLSGMNVPAVRAITMLSVFILLYISGKEYLSHRALIIALFITILLNPFQLLNPGLYFSYIAVFIILLMIKVLSANKYELKNKFYWVIQLQCGITCALAPLAWFYFYGFGVIGILLNIIAIPIMAFCILPSLIFLTLFSYFFEMGILIEYFDLLISVLLDLLMNIPADLFWIDMGYLNWQTLVLLYVIFLLLCCRITRFLALLPLTVIFLNQIDKMKPSWQLDVMDVGHGLSIFVTQEDNLLVYDLGAEFNGNSITKSQLLPYIQANKLNVIHTIISHMDNDHAGGLKDWISAGYGDTLLYGLQNNQIPNSCKPGIRQFGTLTLTILWPESVSAISNNNSCVLKIDDGNFSVLLTGDIHKKVEQQLTRNFPNLTSDILISPHHGSITSSSKRFLQSVSPTWVIHSNKFNGRWQMPHPKVVDRYQSLSIKQLQTAIHGQVSIKFWPETYSINWSRNKENYWFLSN